MKKIFAILLTLALLCSMAVIPVSAETPAITAPWVKFMGDTAVTTTTENGETVYSFSNINNSYVSAAVDIMPILKTLIEGNDQITVKIGMEVKIDYNQDFEGEEFPIAGLIRAGGLNDKIKDPEAFKVIYKNAKAGGFSDTGGGNYSIRFFENEVVDDSWTALEGEVTFTATDINAGLWQNLNVCFDRMNAYEACKTMYVKNTTIEVTDYEEGDGEILVDLNQEVNIPGADGGALDPSTLDLNANADAMDTPELPEGNYLDTKWTKGYAAQDVIEGTFRDEPMYSMVGWKNAYGSPFLDILPAVKAAMGEEDEITVYIVFDIRVINYESMKGETHPFGVKVRPQTTDLTKEKEGFEENYLGATFTHNNSGDVRLTLLGADKKKITENWERIEFEFTFTAEDVEDGLWESWNLCFDNVSTFKKIGAIQVKGMGVFNAEEYEPINIDETENKDDGGEKKPVTKPSDGSVKEIVLHNPIGGGRYQITFMDAVDTEVEGLVDEGGNGQLLIIIGASAGAVVVLGALIGIVIAKKKSSAKEDQ